MKAPCRSCELLDADKSGPACMSCSDRRLYVQHISRTTHNIPEEKMESAENSKKTCKHCEKTLDRSEFRDNPAMKDKKESHCRICRKTEARERYVRKTVAIQDIEPTKPLKINVKVVPVDNTPQPLPKRGPKEINGKPDWAVFPFQEASAVANVFAYGVKKYGRPFSYRDGIPPTELLSAIFRHAIKIQEGELLDEESGLPHWAHIAANGIMAMSKKATEE